MIVNKTCYRVRSRGVSLACTLLAICVTLAGCTSDGYTSSPFGRFSDTDAIYARSLDGVQVDWWPKDDDGLLTSGKSDVSFNQNKDNPDVLGHDERQFLSLAPMDGDRTGNFSRIITIKAGNQYRGVAFFHNGSDDTDSTATRLSVGLPSYVLRRTAITAKVASAQSRPVEVASQAVLTTEIGQPAVFLSIESAWVSIKGQGRTYELDPQRLTSAHGADIGCKNSDGYIPNGNDCWGAVIFTFKAVKMSEVATMYLAHAGDKNYQNSIIYTPGEQKILVAIELRNTGDQVLKDVTLDIPQFAKDSAITLDINTIAIQHGEQPWQAATATDSGSVSVGDVDAGKSVTMGVDAIVHSDISSALCQNGRIAISGQVFTKTLVGTKAQAYIFPEPSRCSN